MSNIPFEKQRLPVDLVEQIEREIALGNGVSGDILLAAIEQSVSLQLAAPLRDVLSKFSVPAVKRRGRPSNCKGQEDFAMEKLDARYRKLLRQYENSAAKPNLAPPNGSIRRTSPPSELAYRRLAHDMAKELGNIDWRSVANKHSNWKIRFHSADNHVGSEDFDAEIERRFPAPKRRS
jgi:hypothetical protein